MGNELFGVDISGILADEVGDGVLDATLIKVVQGSRTTGQLTGGRNPTDVPFTCKGFIDNQAVRFRAGTVVRSGNKVVVLLGDTIDGGNQANAPKPGDKITIEGTQYVIPEDGKIDRDPAAATYTCEVRAL